MTALLVAGEASGDRYAADIARLLARNGVPAFGIGGAASSAAGVDLVGRLESFTAMGGIEVMLRLPALARAHAALLCATRLRKPRAALLFGFSEYCARLGRRLRKEGVRVLWCMPPQIWAWRPWRTTSLARSADKMAVILPFEQSLWRSAGVDALYVGHPILDVPRRIRAVVRTEWQIPEHETAIALLPGSRPQEVRRHAPAMLESPRLLRERGLAVSGRLIVSPHLDGATREWLCAQADRHAIAWALADAALGAAPSLSGFDACIVASGTASLEAAIAGIPAIIVYRMTPTSYWLARLLVRVPYAGLPNLLLGRRAYPELLQNEATSANMVEELAIALASRESFEGAGAEIRRLLAFRGGAGACNGATVAERTLGWIMDWLR